jgi:predicted site-specific integrase-resolvase
MGDIRYSVRQLAGLAGVSVRTLHVYDKMGLLKPSVRTDAGYHLVEALTSHKHALAARRDRIDT